MTVYRNYSAFYFLGGLADMFLSIMLWFIFDENKKPSFVIDNNRVFAVEDVINLDRSSVNLDCEEDEQETVEHNSARQSISRIMIEQFFNEVEGPDRNWNQDYKEVLDEDIDR